ncbi:MAG: hypothetical protein RMY27_28035 [Nostoc sp. DedQUE09]|nr:hypothetical protein [Nostoc sp. DedQUE09]
MPYVTQGLSIIAVVTQIRTVLIAQSPEKTGFLLSTQHSALST